MGSQYPWQPRLFGVALMGWKGEGLLIKGANAMELEKLIL